MYSMYDTVLIWFILTFWSKANFLNFFLTLPLLKNIGRVYFHFFFLSYRSPFFVVGILGVIFVLVFWLCEFTKSVFLIYPKSWIGYIFFKFVICPPIQVFGIFWGSFLSFWCWFLDSLNFQKYFFNLFKKWCRVYFLHFVKIIHHLGFGILGGLLWVGILPLWIS